MLSDPDRRHAYDILGPESLKTKWNVGTHYQTADEVASSYWSQIVASLSEHHSYGDITRASLGRKP